MYVGLWSSMRLSILFAGLCGIIARRARCNSGVKCCFRSLDRRPLKKAVSNVWKTANYMNVNCRKGAGWILHERVVGGHIKGLRESVTSQRQCSVRRREKVGEGKSEGELEMRLGGYFRRCSMYV